jgi:hypothetical protein
MGKSGDKLKFGFDLGLLEREGFLAVADYCAYGDLLMPMNAIALSAVVFLAVPAAGRSLEAFVSKLPELKLPRPASAHPAKDGRI